MPESELFGHWRGSFTGATNHNYGRNMSLSAEALKVLERFDWPGNIRQLQNVLERTVLVSDEEFIAGQHIQEVTAKESRVHLPSHNETHRPPLMHHTESMPEAANQEPLRQLRYRIDKQGLQ
ncbi:sigma 54-interacting transcriptional regulator [Mangrovitalea sediminis]